MKTTKSNELYQRALGLMPGGVNSPVRSCRAVGAGPIFVIRGQGASVTDVDGNSYLDYVCSWGPLILGHAHPAVVQAVQEAAAKGSSFGIPTPGEVELAGLLTQCVPSMEMVRLVNSGTEATMSAIRLARGYTGRNLVIKFDGCYHGHADFLLVQAGSGAATLGIPGSAGVPTAVARHTLSLPYNDLEQVEAVLKEKGDEVAAVIVEPVAGNMGVVPPEPGFLEGLRLLCDQSGALLIFDEVITGFRLGLGGAQAKYQVGPDLTTLGKIIGGGLPVGAYGGRREIMSKVAPEGDVYQAGTLAGNPIAVAAGIATIKELMKPGVYDYLEEVAGTLFAGLAQVAAEQGVGVYCTRVSSMGSMFFTAGPVRDFASAQRADTRAYGRWFRTLLAGGIYVAPSQFEATFVSLAHRREDIERTLAIAADAMAAVKSSGLE